MNKKKKLKKKYARERKERVYTHTHIDGSARTHVYNKRREREDGEKKADIKHNAKTNASPPLFNSARHNPIQRYGEYCLLVCVCVCV